MAYPPKYTIADLINYAAAKGGKCLSATYNGAKASYKWQCARGHEWVAQAGPIILRGTWCLKCGLQKYTIEDFRKCAEKKRWVLFVAYLQRGESSLPMAMRKWARMDGDSSSHY